MQYGVPLERNRNSEKLRAQENFVFRLSGFVSGVCVLYLRTTTCVAACILAPLRGCTRARALLSYGCFVRWLFAGLQWVIYTQRLFSS
ncbi:MAG TPA: hypothetical protein VGU64_21085, partial [Terriglobales bacterium]|nr:hypothetical protein [Terriglobales bacterium]